jgi:hypothetical protein
LRPYLGWNVVHLCSEEDEQDSSSEEDAEDVAEQEEKRKIADFRKFALSHRKEKPESKPNKASGSGKPLKKNSLKAQLHAALTKGKRTVSAVCCEIPPLRYLLMNVTMSELDMPG